MPGPYSNIPCYTDLWLDARLPLAPGLSLRARLDRWQEIALRNTLALAMEHSRFYRNTLKGLGDPFCLSIAELGRLPFTRSEDIAACPEDFLCVSLDEAEHATSVPLSIPTSGTTGGMKRLFFTAEELRGTVDYYRYNMLYVNRDETLAPTHLQTRPNARVMVFMSSERPGSVGRLLQRALAELGAACRVHGFVRDIGEALRDMRDFAPTSLVGQPGQMLALARTPESAFLRGMLHSVLISGDAPSRALRRGIASAWDCRVLNHYALTESGLAGIMDCLEGSGHPREADLLFEVVPPEGEGGAGRAESEPLPEGQWGEVVFTTLTRRAMPLIRYRTGDLGRFVPGPCACGSMLRRMEIKGRLASRVTLPGAAPLYLHELDEILHALPWLAEYQAAFRKDSRNDSLRLTLFVNAFAPADAADQARRAVLRHPVVAACAGRGQLCVPLPEVLGAAEASPGSSRAAALNPRLKRSFS